MIVDERMITYIHSLETAERSVIEEIEQEALETFVPIIRKETQTFPKGALAMKQPMQGIGSRNSNWIFGDSDE